jgi:hypothetical protein
VVWMLACAMLQLTRVCLERKGESAKIGKDGMVYMDIILNAGIHRPGGIDGLGLISR